jgi:hypothetical protein
MRTIASKDKGRAIFAKFSVGLRVEADGWEVNLHFKEAPAH